MFSDLNSFICILKELYNLKQKEVTNYLGSVVVRRHRVDVGFPLKEMKYLYFHFFTYDIEAKRGVKFCHLTLNVYRIRRKSGRLTVSTLDSVRFVVYTAVTGKYREAKKYELTDDSSIFSYKCNFSIYDILKNVEVSRHYVLCSPNSTHCTFTVIQYQTL